MIDFSYTYVDKLILNKHVILNMIYNVKILVFYNTLIAKDIFKKTLTENQAKIVGMLLDRSIL